MNKTKETLSIIFSIVLIVAIGYISLTPSGKGVWNNWVHSIRKVDDATNYNTLKKVEDTCRSMISSYQSDKATYEQYKNSNSEEKQSWAEQARMRANKTASTYNNYILSSSYVWKDNVPTDIMQKLPFL